MKKELQEQLKEKYQILYPEFDSTKRFNEPILDRGIECGDGWFSLLDDLMSWIKFQHLTNGYPKITIVQIKEKFGYLSFYYDNPKFDDVVWSSWKAKLPEDELKRQFTRTISEIRGAISFASSISNTICEKCGSNKNVSRIKGNWIRYYCEDCRIEDKRIKEENEKS
jgi:RNase P subunit RPR2